MVTLSEVWATSVVVGGAVVAAPMWAIVVGVIVVSASVENLSEVVEGVHIVVDIIV